MSENDSTKDDGQPIIEILNYMGDLKVMFFGQVDKILDDIQTFKKQDEEAKHE